MPTLNNITRILKTHKLSKFIISFAAIIGAIVGITKNFDDIKKIFISKNDFVQILIADFQNPRYNEIIVRISNPKSSKESFTEFTLDCYEASNKNVRYFATNNTNNPYISTLYIPGSRYAPFILEAGAIENVHLQFPKFNNSVNSEGCIKMSVNWVDNTGSFRKSEIINIAKNTSYTHRIGPNK
jgi:hypothetical protein